MANAVVSFWTACIKELQRLADKTGDADAASSSAAVSAVRQHLADQFIQQPPLPNAVWKKLVQDVQVTCALGGGGWIAKSAACGCCTKERNVQDKHMCNVT
jgi:hypothetical protein